MSLRSTITLCALGLATLLILGCGGGDEGTEDGGDTAATTSNGGKTSGGKTTGKGSPGAMPKLMYAVASKLGMPRPLHTDQIEAIRAHPDGKHFMTASKDGTVCIWTYADWKCIKELDAGKRCWDAAISADGNKLVASDGTTEATEWDLKTGKVTGRQMLYSMRMSSRTKITAVAYAQKDASVLMGGSLAGIRSSSLGPNKPLAGVEGRTIERIARSQNLKVLASTCAYSKTTFIDADTTKVISVAPWPGRDVALNADGSKAFTVAETGEVGIIDGTKGAVKRLPKLKFKSPGRSVAIAPDGSWMAAGFLNGKLLVFDAEGTLIHDLVGHTVAVTSMLATPDGKHLITGDAEGNLRRWNPKAGKAAPVGKGHTGAVGGLAFSKDGKTLWSAGADGQLIAWSVPGGSPRAHAYSLAFTAMAVGDGEVLLGCGNGAAVRHDGKDFRLLRTLEGRVNCVALAGKVALYGLNSFRRLVAVDTASGDVKKEWKDGGKAGKIHSVVVAPDGSFAAYGMQNSRDIPRIALPGFGPGTPIGGGGPPIKGLTISSDGKKLAIAGKGICFIEGLDGSKRERIAVSGTQLHGVAMIKGSATHIALAVEHLDRNNRALARVGKVLLFKMDNARKHYQELVGAHVRPVKHVVVSPDGKYMASAGVDGAVVLYKLQ